jgi:hypothetical protein
MDQLYITVPYMIFYWFLKNSNFHSKSKCYPTVLPKITSLGHKVTKTLYFLVVTPIFWIDPHILDLVYIMVRYMSFYGFWKNSNFRSKSAYVSLRVYQKSSVWNKNRPKLCISWSCPPYCGSLIHTSPVDEFLCVFKKIKFSLKIHSC